MKKIMLPLVIGIISFATITGCKKDAKAPMATNVSSATVKTPSTNTPTTTQSQPAPQSGSNCHHSCGSGCGGSGTH